MKSSAKILEELNKITSSNEFKDSKSYKNLLTYLVNCSLNGTKPTENSIASDGLNKKVNFDSGNDATVRVYIYNLRKKLDSYYLNEGKNDQIKITIPKGHHYEVEFVSNEKSVSILRYPKILIYSLILLFAGNIFLLTYMFSKKNTPAVAENSVPWSDIINSEFPVLLVIGDYYVLKDSTSERNNYVRDIFINSYSDFERLAKEGEIEKNKFVQTEITFLGKFALWCFNELSPLLNSLNKPVELKLSSQLVWDDLSKYDIIFIGPFKTLNILNNFVSGLNSSYQIKPNRIFFNDTKNDSLYEYHSPKNFQTGYVKDYSLVAKLPGLNGNNVLMFSSTHDIGHISTVKNFVNQQFLDSFQDHFTNDEFHNNYFESIFEVEGFERTGFFPKLTHFRNIEDNYSVGLNSEPMVEQPK
ncbi:MAG: helix-turn-helix domain-containing protein [Melioribacteraceae bacterium]|nr:helix-turn-helix domain-containing protein [Melioribacteraceae bacterium]